MYGDNELHCQYRECVAKSAEQHPSLASALASSVMPSQVKRGHLPFATWFLRISFYPFCFSLSFRCLRGFSLTFFNSVSHAHAYMRAFPAISTFLLSQPSHVSCFKLENRVAVVPNTSAGNLEIATLFKKRFVKLLKFVRKVLVRT